jgi:hypothetical protein
LNQEISRPGGVVGSVEITDCTGTPGDYQWHLSKPLRMKRPIPLGNPTFWPLTPPSAKWTSALMKTTASGNTYS